MLWYVTSRATANTEDVCTLFWKFGDFSNLGAFYILRYKTFDCFEYF